MLELLTLIRIIIILSNNIEMTLRPDFVSVRSNFMNNHAETISIAKNDWR